MNTEKRQFATRIDPKVFKNLKRLAVELEKPVNHLVEEAIKDLLKKYESKSK